MFIAQSSSIQLHGVAPRPSPALPSSLLILTTAPGIRRNWPSVTTVSPALTPRSIIVSV